jgi:ketosteroid isomerase-like protein
MSQENVEVVRRSLEAFERGGLDMSLDYFDPEVEWTTTDAYLEAATYRGHQGVRHYFETLSGEFGAVRLEAEEMIDAGEQVVAPVRMSGRGKTSGASVHLRLTLVCSVCDGKIVRIRNHLEKADALESAGLPAQDSEALDFRRGMEAYSRGDYEAALAGFDPAIEWTVHADVAPDATTYHGHEGVRRFWETWAEAISGMALEVEECRSVGRHRVLAIVRAHGTGAGSGAPVTSARFAEIADFQDGRVVRVRLFGNVGEALAAVGLQE